ncbi:Der1-like family-domain-containing protein [Phycomyces nitens]|nr:Der1-like family-domain-containing protein [Phycomyces nitens]
MTEAFETKRAEYAYYLLVTSVFQLTAASILGLTVMTNGLSMSIAYLWGQHYQSREVSFMLGLRFKALYLPWVILASDFLTSGKISMASLVGIGASRAYCYLKDEYPRQGGRQLVAVPEFWVRFFNRGFSGGSSNPRLLGNSPWSSSGFRLGR